MTPTTKTTIIYSTTKYVERRIKLSYYCFSNVDRNVGGYVVRRVVHSLLGAQHHL